MKRILTLSAVFLFPLWIAAQDMGQSAAQDGFVSFGLSYQRWTLENAGEPGQIVLPITIFYPIRTGLYVNASNMPALTEYGDSRITGLSDTYIGVTYILPGQFMMLNFGLGTPTGKTELTGEEFELVQILSENAFQFRLPSYGQGFHAKAGVGFAYKFNETVVVGAGVNYVYKMAYRPVKDLNIDYQPGPETGIYLGFGARVNPDVQINVDCVYTMYGSDMSEGAVVFVSGNKILLNAAVLAGLRGTTLYASARWRQKGRNELGIGLIPEAKNSNGDQTELSALWQFLERGPLAVRLLGEGRLYSKNEYGTRGATIAGGGIGLQYRFNPSVTFGLNLKYYTGTLLSVVDTSISGLDVYSTVRIRL